MRSSRVNGGELRGQPANPGSPGKWPLKLSVCASLELVSSSLQDPANHLLYFIKVLPSIALDCIPKSTGTARYNENVKLLLGIGKKH